MPTICYECALRAGGRFKAVTSEELSSISEMLREQVSLPAGAEIIRAGNDSSELYTLYSGWAFRFKTLPDGRRQILNFLLLVIYSAYKPPCSMPRCMALRR
jgi:CRP-like cAMP-binding protein